MLRRRVLAFAVMCVSLAVLLVGLPYVNTYTNQTVTQTPIFSKSINVPVNGTGTIHVVLNGTETADYCSSETIRDGAIRSAVLNQEAYTKWLNGSLKPQWYYSQPTLGSGDAHYWEMFQNAATDCYHVYWNPDSPTSREVTLKICEQTKQTTYNYATFGTGVALIASGAVAGLTAAYMLGRKTLFITVALAMIVVGVLLAPSSPPQTMQTETTATFTVTVVANSTTNEPLHYNGTGYYYLMLKGTNGPLNATVISEEEYAQFQAGQRDVYIRPWQGSHYPLSVTAFNGGSPVNARLLIVNSESHSQEITVDVDHLWVKEDYTGNVVGALLIAVGVVIPVLTFRRFLKGFNQALENQT